MFTTISTGSSTPVAAAPVVPDDPAPRWALVALFLASLALGLWFGYPRPDSGRFNDESYARKSIAAILRSHSLRPISGYHPLLSYLPQGVVLLAAQEIGKATGLADSPVLADDRHGFKPFGYRLGRFVQSLFAALSALWTFRIGRSMFGARAGLIAAVLAAAAPWQIRQSGLINEDMMLVFFSLLAFDWSLRAAQAPGLASFSLAGLGIGLALSTKFNAGPIALPLAAAALLRVRREPRQMLWLGAAGAVALATFLALNPYLLIDPELYRHDFGRTFKQYEEWSGRSSRLGTLALSATTLLSPDYLSWTATASLAGILLLAWRLRPGSPTPEPQRVEGAMLLAFLIGYPVLYATVTKNPSPHNFFQLVPFAALAGGWAIDRAWRRLAPRPAGLPAAVLAVVLGASAVAYVYRGTVVRTVNLAEKEITARLDGLGERVVYFTGPGSGPILEGGRQRAAVVVCDDLATVAPRLLARADAEVFPRDRLAGSGRDFYLRRLAQADGGGIVRLLPAPFVARGPELIAILHPWQPLGERRALPLRADGAVLSGEIPPGPPGSWTTISLVLRRPRIRRLGAPPVVKVGGRRVPVLWVQTKRGTVRSQTVRFPSPRVATGLRIHLPTRAEPGNSAAFRCWTPPKPRAAPSPWPMITPAAARSPR